MFGVIERPPVVGGKIQPLEAYGVKLMSLGFLVERDAPAIWRGPIIMKIVQQFLRDVEWGQLDYFLVDLPPGTGDAQLSLVQATHVSGALIVTTPQEMAVGDALRGARMFERVGVPVHRHDGEHERRSPTLTRGRPVRPLLLRRRAVAWRTSSGLPCSARCRSSPSWPRSPTPASRSSWPSPASPAAAELRAIADSLQQKTAGRAVAAADSPRREPGLVALVTLLTDFGTSDAYVAEMKGALLTAAPRRSPGGYDPRHPSRRRPSRCLCAGPGLAPVPHRHRPPRRGGSRSRHRARRRSPSPRTGTTSSVPTTACSRWCCTMPRWRSSSCPRPTAPRPPSTDATSSRPAAAALAAGATLADAGPALRRDARAAGLHRAALRGQERGGRDRVRGPLRQPGHQPHHRAGAALRYRSRSKDLELGPLRRTYGDVPTGGLLAYLGSGGQVEIAVRNGSAARRLGMGVGGRIRARLG